MNASLIVKIQERENMVLHLEKLVQCYKEEKVRIHEQTTEKWKELKNFYEGEIEKLEFKLKSEGRKLEISKKSYAE